MTPSQQLQLRRANKHARQTKQADQARERLTRVVAEAPPNIIAGLPVSVVPGPVRDRLLAKSLKRQLAADMNPDDWSSDQINELIFMHNTICRALAKRPNASVKAATLALCETLERIKARKREHGRYGATGEEWQQLKRHVNTMQTWLETLPGGVLFEAEESAGRWHEVNRGDEQ